MKRYQEMAQNTTIGNPEVHEQLISNYIQDAIKMNQPILIDSRVRPLRIVFLEESKGKKMMIDNIDVTVPGPYNSLEQVRAVNWAAGRFYFGQNENSFFGPQYGPMIHKRFFIESCKRPYGPRISTVMMVDDDGHMHTVRFSSHVVGVRAALDPDKWFRDNGEARKALDWLLLQRASEAV